MTDTTLHHRTTCPFCGAHHDRITSVKVEAHPKDGDASMCFSCGEVNIVDNNSDDGMRKPTKRERLELNGDERIRELRQAWRTVKRQWQ